MNYALNLALKRSQTPDHLPLISVMLVAIQCLVVRLLLQAWNGAFCGSYSVGAHEKVVEMCMYVCVSSVGLTRRPFLILTSATVLRSSSLSDNSPVCPSEATTATKSTEIRRCTII